MCIGIKMAIAEKEFQERKGKPALYTAVARTDVEIAASAISNMSNNFRRSHSEFALNPAAASQIARLAANRDELQPYHEGDIVAGVAANLSYAIEPLLQKKVTFL